MHPIKHNQLQTRTIANLIKSTDNLRILHTLTNGKPREYFTGPHLVFYDAIQLLNDKNATVSIEWVVWTVKNSKAGKAWASNNQLIADTIEADIKKLFNTPVNFSALVASMVNSRPTKVVLPPLPIKRCVLSRRQIGFLEVARKQLKIDKWNEIKKHLGISTAGVLNLSRVEASALIDYIKKENLLDGTK